MGEIVRYIKGIPVGIPFRAVLDPLPQTAVSKKDCETFIILPYRSLQAENTIVNIVPEKPSSKSKLKTGSGQDVQELPEDVPVFKVVSNHDVDTLKPGADVRCENVEESDAVVQDKQLSHLEPALEDGSEAGNSRHSSDGEGQGEGHGEGQEADSKGQELMKMNNGSTSCKAETKSSIVCASISAAEEYKKAPGNSGQSSSHGEGEEAESNEVCGSSAAEDRGSKDITPGSTGQDGEPTNRSAVESPMVEGRYASAVSADVQVGPHTKGASTTHFDERPFSENDTTTSACVKSGRKRRLDDQEPAQKMRVISLDTEDNEDEDNSSRRRSQRIRSKGVHVDYKSIENKYAAGISDSSTDTAEEADEDDNILALYHDAENTSDSSEEEDDNSESELNSKAGDKYDPDFDPFDMEEETSGRKKKKVAHSERQNQSGSLSEPEASNDSFNESPDKAAEKTERALRRRLDRKHRKSLNRQKGPKIRVQLEQHQDKYKKTLFKSFARKDRNKQFTEEMLECLICNGFSTSDKVPMEKHLEEHLNGLLNCRKCDHIASATHNLSQHVRSVHSKTAYVCEECGKEFPKGSLHNRLRTHMGRVHNKPMVCCQLCKQKGLDVRFISKTDLRKHRLQEHMDLLKSCDSCGRLYDNAHYDFHVENCNGSIEYPCERCGKLVPAGAMAKHVRKEHEKVLNEKCPHCDYIATRKHLLRRHLKTHQDQWDGDGDSSGSELLCESADDTGIYWSRRSDNESDNELDESFIVRAKDAPKFYISKVLKSHVSITGRLKKIARVYNSYQYCKICDKKVSNFSEHIEGQKAVHQKCSEIQLILSEKDKNKKRTLRTLLRAKFNHHYNMRSIKNGKGEILLERRPSANFRLEDYGPCPRCFQWVAKALLQKHTQTCAAMFKQLKQTPATDPASESDMRTVGTQVKEGPVTSDDEDQQTPPVRDGQVTSSRKRPIISNSGASVRIAVKQKRIVSGDVLSPNSDCDQSAVSPVLPGIEKVDRTLSSCTYEDKDSRPIARDVANRDIYISLIEKSDISKFWGRKKSDRVYNSRHPCPFCGEIKTNFSHHIFSKKHESEKEIIAIKKTENEKERKCMIAQLRLKGCHENNMRVLGERRGEMFLIRRTNVGVDGSGDINEEELGVDGKTFDVTQYGPCPLCFGWVLTKSLKRHTNSCISSNIFSS